MITNEPISALVRVKHPRVIHTLSEEGSSKAVFLDYKFIGSYWVTGKTFRGYSFSAGMGERKTSRQIIDYLVASYEGR